jgi:type 2 lantibiotic biosynthesis protein LanM
MNYIDSQILSIIADASFIWERCNLEKFSVNIEEINQENINYRLDKWCQTVTQGNLETFQKRLQWDGLDLDTVSLRLDKIQLAKNQPIPAWAETLIKIITVASVFESENEILLPIDSEKPIPFEDILLPAIKVAREKLLTRFEISQLSSDSLPLSIISENAYYSLERSLLEKLHKICGKTLYFEFCQSRPFGKSLLNLIGIKAAPVEDNKIDYNRFVNQLLQDGLLQFFQKYPVLGRFVATAIDLWVETTTEFIQRLAQDTKLIEKKFNVSPNQRFIPLGKIVDLKISLSDPHNGGRISLLLTFKCGLQLVYKPKDLNLEFKFNQLLEWFNQHSGLLDFKIIEVLNCGSYGWVECVTYQPCIDEAAAARFYERAGILLCLLHVLQTTDCHYENLIASGEYPVLIDMETLLHHHANLMEKSLTFHENETAAMQKFWNSVIRTRLLPSWDFSDERLISYDISGFGSTTPQLVSGFPKWREINTDKMSFKYETVISPLEKNTPFLGEVPLSAQDYQSQIVKGFEQMYRFLMENKAVLLSPENPLAQLQNQQVRFIFRPTRVYGEILQKIWTADYFKHGVDYSIALDCLSRAFLVAQNKPHAWSILESELQDLAQLDIPFFIANSSNETLSLSSGQEIKHYFQESSYQRMVTQIQTLNNQDLAWQIDIINGCFHAQIARIKNGNYTNEDIKVLPLLSREQLIEEAIIIATEIEAKSIPDDSSINWIGLGYVTEAERFQLQVLNDSLYDGRCGIALFFAALYKVTQDEKFYKFALKILQPLRQRVQFLDWESQQFFARLAGLGGAVGLGSMIYTLVKVGELLKDESLWEDAKGLANWLTPELIAADKNLNVISGCAGEILGLLSLYEVTGNASILDKAVVCGQHLLKCEHNCNQLDLHSFFHSQDGVAYALLRLYSVTQNIIYWKNALKISDIFSQTAEINLARLGINNILGDVRIQPDINFRWQPVDHLYSGNCREIEILLIAAQQYSRPDWQQMALETATNVVSRRKEQGDYQLFGNLSGVFNPSFFHGLSGIGYELLRLASNDLPAVLLWE